MLELTGLIAHSEGDVCLEAGGVLNLSLHELLRMWVFLSIFSLLVSRIENTPIKV